MNEKAFTLIELLVVIAIIGILTSFIIISMSGASDVANDSRRKADINQLAKAVMIYKTSHDTLPIETCLIGSNCSDDNVFGSASILRDPDGSYYTYRSSDGNYFTITSTLSNDYQYYFDSSTGKYIEGLVSVANGVCGSANKIFYVTATDYGIDTFCASGSLSATPDFPEIGETVNWTCFGDGGTNASCGASKPSSCVDVAGLDCEEFLDGNYVVNKYTLTGDVTTSTTWTAPEGVTEVDYLIIAGGGGGGHAGGGAGGLLNGENLEISETVSIMVGAGGLAGAGNGYSGISGGVGGNSSFSGLLSYGGGGGAAYSSSGGTLGGSGGGGASGASPYNIPGNGTTGQGFLGGVGGGYYGVGGGGGGGKRSAGSNAIVNVGGNGGSGFSSSITGVTTNYAGGGGGGGLGENAGAGVGGIGGGGDGGTVNGTDGVNGLGGGGGGAGSGLAGKGGSGVVIIRYLAPQ